MNDVRRLLLVGGSLVCLLVVASTLPAADPRLDVGAETPVEAPDNATPAPRPTPEPEGQQDNVTGPAIRVAEPARPGTQTEVRLVGVDDPGGADVAVDGEYVGTTDAGGELDVEVPVARTMTVTADVPSRSEAVSRTVAIGTDVRILTDGARAPGRPVEVEARAGRAALSDAAVVLDDERVGTTGPEGTASVTLPATAGPAKVGVERGAFAGERTIDVAEPVVSLRSPLLFPGSFAAVTVTADGVPVDGAAIAVNGEQVGETDENGEALIQLPLAGDVRVTAEVGAETAATTVGDLYLRLTAVVVLVPGFLLGSVWTAGRLLAAIEVEAPAARESADRGAAGGGGDLFVLLADLLGGVADAIERLLLALGGAGGAIWALSWPSLSFPSVSMSRPEISLPAIGGVDLSLPSLSVPGVGGWFGAGDDPDPEVRPDAGGQLDSTSETVRGRRAQIRAVWHAFLDALGVENRETMTAGQVARRAVTEGFRAVSVWRLVATFRAVEYGGHDPSPERVAEVRAVIEELLADDDEEGPQ